MTNENIQEFIDRLNNGQFKDTILLRQISEYVFVSKVRQKKNDLRNEPKFSLTYYDFFFIKNDKGVFVGAVVDMYSDLHWYITPKNRKKGYLVNALRSAILPYIFYDDNKNLETQRITITKSEIGELNYHNSKKVALKLGFKATNKEESEFLLTRDSFDWSEENINEINTCLNEEKLNEFRKRISYIYQDLESMTHELQMAYGDIYELESLKELSNKLCCSKATIEDIIWENNKVYNKRRP